MSTTEFDGLIARYQELLSALLRSSPILFDESLRKNLPEEGGVYRISEFGSKNNESVYVGESINLRNRIHGNHLMGNRRASTLKRKLIEKGNFQDETAVKKYLKEVCQVQYVIIFDVLERAGFEHFAISILGPRYND